MTQWVGPGGKMLLHAYYPISNIAAVGYVFIELNQESILIIPNYTLKRNLIGLGRKNTSAACAIKMAMPSGHWFLLCPYSMMSTRSPTDLQCSPTLRTANWQRLPQRRGEKNSKLCFSLPPRRPANLKEQLIGMSTAQLIPEEIAAALPEISRELNVNREY